MSASKQRANAKENDYTAFSQGVPKSMNDKDTRKLFNDVRKGMGLKEEKKFKRHVDLGKLNELRENYVKGSLYEIGDTVVIKESEEVGIITVLGSNYVIIETNDKKKVRKWLDAIELVEKKLTPAELKKREEIAKAIEKDNPKMPMDKKMAIATATAKRVAEKIVDDVSTIIEKEKEKARVAQDKDVKDKKGSQPSVYYKGVAKKTKGARASHLLNMVRWTMIIQRHTKMHQGIKKRERKDQNLVHTQNHTDKCLEMTNSINRNMISFKEYAEIQESSTKGLQNKASKSGFAYKTLKKVFDRGVAAWRTGHRPGTTPPQWGMARVNAFITKKKKGIKLNHDQDLG